MSRRPTAGLAAIGGADFSFLIVGGLSFFVDIRAFIALSRIEVPITSASITSFILATARNYLLVQFLYSSAGRFRRRIEMLRFLTVVLVGLGSQHVTGLVLCLSAFNSPNCGEDLPPFLSC